MRLSWGASMGTEAFLLAAMLRAGCRDWWVAYLVLDLLRSAALWNLNPMGLAYFYVWSFGLAVLALAQFVAVLDQARTRGPWLASWLYGAMACGAWVVALSPATWPPARQSAMMAWNAESLLCLAVLLGSHSGGVFLRTYYFIQAALSTASLASPTPTWAQTVGFVQCATVSTLFLWWSLKINTRSFSKNG